MTFRPRQKYYLERARECREQAEEMHDPRLRKSMLETAEAYEKMAGSFAGNKPAGTQSELSQQARVSSKGTYLARRADMADDKKQRAPHDAARINIHEDYELQYWAQELGVSKE